MILIFTTQKDVVLLFLENVRYVTLLYVHFEFLWLIEKIYHPNEVSPSPYLYLLFHCRVVGFVYYNEIDYGTDGYWKVWLYYLWSNFKGIVLSYYFSQRYVYSL